MTARKLSLHLLDGYKKVCILEKLWWLFPEPLQVLECKLASDDAELVGAEYFSDASLDVTVRQVRPCVGGSKLCKIPYLRHPSTSERTTEPVDKAMSPKVVKITSQKNLTCVAFRPDGILVGADNSGTIHQWRVEDEVEVNQSAMKTKGTVYAAVVSPDGQWIVTSGSGSSVVVWSTLTQQRVLEVTDHDTQASYVCALDVSSDSRLFASGSHDKTVRIFDIISGARLLTPLCHDASVIDVRFSPDTSRIATATHKHPSVGVYNTYSGDKLFEISVRTRRVDITPLAWSADGQQLFAASSGKITCLDTSSSSVSEWPIHDSKSRQVSIVVSDKFIACSAGSSVSFWNPSSHEEICRISHAPATSTCIAMSHDGRHLALGHDAGIIVYTLQELLPSERHFHAPDPRFVSTLPLMRVSESVLQSFAAGNPIATESMLSDEIMGSSNPSKEILAIRAFIRAQLGEWKTATEDAEMSLKVQRSPIGQTAKCVGLAGGGQEEAALREFDLTFHCCDPNDIELLLVIKSILAFVCNKREEAISRLRSLIDAVVGETSRGYYLQVLGNMYLRQGDYEDAVQILRLVKTLSTPNERGPLMTIHIIFGWSFQNTYSVAWQRLCETLYISRSIKEVGETLERMVAPLPEDEREAVHGHILQEIIRRSGEVTLLAWTGKSSNRNSCLPNSPAVYGQTTLVLPSLGAEELGRRTTELRTVFSAVDAVATYRCITRLQPARFTHFCLLLPCIVFRVKGLRRVQGDVYRVETTTLGDVEFTTTDSLPLNEARKFVLVNPWLHLLRDECGCTTWGGDDSEDTESNSDDENATEADDGLAHASLMIEEAPATSTPSKTDEYARALELIARLGQPFSVLLLLKQPGGAYKRVAADCEISVCGMGNNVPMNIHVEVLEVL